MRLPTRVIREWKTVTSTDGEEIVWVAVLDNGEFALCVELPERREPMDPEVWEMLQRAGNERQHQDEETVITDGLGRMIGRGLGPIMPGQQPQADPPVDRHDAFSDPEVGVLSTDEQDRDANARYRSEREQMRQAHEGRQR